MQAASDIFLGWTKGPVTGHDFYVRQLHDMKGSADVERATPEKFLDYAHMCGWTLARAHARTGDSAAIAAYMGSATTFDDALTDFAEHYAEQNGRDYEAFMAATRSGRLEIDTSN